MIRKGLKVRLLAALMAFSLVISDGSIMAMAADSNDLADTEFYSEENTENNDEETSDDSDVNLSDDTENDNSDADDSVNNGDNEDESVSDNDVSNEDTENEGTENEDAGSEDIIDEDESVSDNDAFDETGVVSDNDAPDETEIVSDNEVSDETSDNDVSVSDESLNAATDISEYCTISSSGELTAYSGTNIANIIIPSSVKSIGKGVFKKHNEIKSVQLPAGLVSIGEGAFWNCEKLETVVWSSSLDSIGKEAFYLCSSLSSADLSGTFVTTIGEYAFYKCASLKTVKFPSVLQKIGTRAFEKASFGTAKDKGNLVIPEKVSYIGIFAFYEAVNLKEVVFEADDSLANGINFGDGMTFCNSSVEKITLSDNVHSIPKGFAHYCDNLESVEWNSALQSIGDGAFELCSSLKSADLSGTNITFVGKAAFRMCVTLETVVFPSSLEKIYEAAFEKAALGTSTNKGTIIIPKKVSLIGTRAFYSVTCLKEVVFEADDSLANGISFGDGMTFCNSSVEKITLSDNVHSIPEMFAYGCKALKEVYISDRVTFIKSGAFNIPSSTKVKIIVTGTNPIIDSYDWSADNRVLASFYTVRFNSNYPGNEENTFYTQGMITGDKTALSTNTFSIAGYEFAGWSKTKAGSVVYKDKQVVTNLAENNHFFDLYAVWKPITFNVKYDSNAGYTSTGKATGSMAVSVFSFVDESNTLTKNKFAIIGYEFAGWDVYPDGRGLTIPDGENIGTFFTELGFVKSKGETLTLYAKWRKIDYSVVTLLDTDGNQLKDENGYVIKDVVLDYNQPLSAKVANLEKSIKGYRLTGWTDKDKKSYAINARNITKQGESITLYAKWSLVNYTIKYNLNGGKATNDSNKNPKKYMITSDDLILKAPEKKGYIFAGWTDQDGNMVRVVEKGSYGNLVLTANWTPISYSIRFNLNDEMTIKAGQKNLYSFEYDEEINLYWATTDIFTVNNDSKEHYIAGWSTTPNGKLKYATGTMVSKLSAEDGAVIELYPVMGKKTYHIMYSLGDSADARAENNKNNPNTFVYNSKPVSIKDPVRPGYVFTGWTASGSETGSACYDSAKKCIKAGTAESIILSANWRPVNYIVKLNKNNAKASFAEGAPTVFGSKERYIGFADRAEFATAGERAVVKNDYYDLIGWNTKPNGKGQWAKLNNGWVSLNGLFVKDKATVTLYAIWEPKTYNIEYINIDPIIRYNPDNPNSQLAGTTNKNVTEYTVTKAVKLVNATKSGFVFKGWYTSYDAVSDTFSGKVTNISTYNNNLAGKDGTIRLYGWWEYK